MRRIRIGGRGALALLNSVGHQDGPFDTPAGLPPPTGGEIAAAAGLDERYVRESAASWSTSRSGARTGSRPSTPPR
jgi:hypothetical protein